MTAVLTRSTEPADDRPGRQIPEPTIRFDLDPALEATQPPEARGLRRDHVRLMVSPGDDEPVHTRFDHLVDHLDAGDLLVVNTSATIPAALDGVLPSGEAVAVHFSTELPGSLWLVEVRRPTATATRPMVLDQPTSISLASGGTVRLSAPYAGSRRLWVAAVDVGEPVVDHLVHHGRPIRYGYVTRDWPIENYRSIFSQDLGSAEMPSASRPFTAEVVADLVRHGVVFAPLILHTGVSSAEFGEPPYPERYAVGRPTAALVNGARDAHSRVVAVGTTVVRALATVTDDRGVVHPGRGWTERFVTPDDPPTAVDGLVTGWHEPEATHLLMLEAVAGHDIVDRAYRAAVAERYLWHEFGDVHLLLREPGRR